MAIKAMKPSGSTVAHAGEIDAVIADEQGMRVDVTAATGIKQLLSGHPTFGAKGSLTAARLLDADPDTGIGGVINVRGPYRLTTIFSDGIPALGRILVGRLGRIGDNNNVTDYGNTMITIGNEVTGGIGLARPRRPRPRKRRRISRRVWSVWGARGGERYPTHARWSHRCR